MSRTFKTLSLSLAPGIVEELAAIGRATQRTAARVAAEIVSREIAKTPLPKEEESRQKSWCCQAAVTAVRGPIVVTCPKCNSVTGDNGISGCPWCCSAAGRREWIPVVVLLCGKCKKQLHGREYEGWATNATT